jgi:hypothetical protein
MDDRVPAVLLLRFNSTPERDGAIEVKVVWLVESRIEPAVFIVAEWIEKIDGDDCSGFVTPTIWNETGTLGYIIADSNVTLITPSTTLHVAVTCPENPIKLVTGKLTH